MRTGTGSPEMVLNETEIAALIEQGTPPNLFENKRVLVLTPDATRTCPLPMVLGAIRQVIGPRCRQLDFMVALGTHTPLPRDVLMALYGISDPDTEFPGSHFFNHRWDLPETFHRLGSLSTREVAELSDGLLAEEVPIVINRAILNYDLVLIAGPVFPHEVVGFSGGGKYLFPGISGGDFLHFFHWLGAVITCKKIIGVRDTPVRRVIDRAVALVPTPIHCLAMVVHPQTHLCGLYVGDVRDAWAAAAELSGRVHVVTKPRLFHTVLGTAPTMYDEMWTAGKVMYKLEQVVAPGGTLIVYAPHIQGLSRTWGRYIEAAGYHVRDYFLAQPDRFRDIPRGVLAHLTHVRGTGAYHNGMEQPDVDLVFATGIPETVCRRIQVKYRNPREVDLAAYQGREDEGILFVDHAGEILHRFDPLDPGRRP